MPGRTRRHNTPDFDATVLLVGVINNLDDLLNQYDWPDNVRTALSLARTVATEAQKRAEAAGLLVTD